MGTEPIATPRQGPTLTIAGSCEGCAYLDPEKSWSRGKRAMLCKEPSLLGRVPRYIGGLQSATPAWCPLLPAARLALAQGIVAEAPCQVSLVRQIGGNLPCIVKGEHVEHRSACGRAWGGDTFVDHPDFDSRAFCDDGSEAQ